MMIEPSTSAHRELGLTDEELTSIIAVLGREPNLLELAMYSVMWSEHCSYKSSRVHLARLPTSGPQVLVGPGENAGVIDAGDGIAVALRIESHNHPSFIEPFQGAATGVGGILRDIFTMGARPIALMDPLFIGPLEDAHSRYILDGVVRGIASYGNSVGVPTIGGQITFDPTYRGNPLVNVFCLGVLPIERLVLSAASGVGNIAVLLGSRTGRDGIGGVSVLASAGFDLDAANSDKRPSVQVGDPYEEKRLIEACLELLDRGIVVGIQDLGGAGITCATSETAARAGLGMDVDVEAIARREPAMEPFEVMTSESQERMLAIIEPRHLEELQAVVGRWEIEASVIGRVTEVGSDGVGRLRVLSGSEVLADVPAGSLADDGPRYHRPIAPPSNREARGADDPRRFATEGNIDADLLALLSDPTWIFRQYDHQLFVNTVFGPGEADAALLKLSGPGVPWSGKALALSSDGNPRWCAVDPFEGTARLVAESALNVACVGARPVALVNCLNFGNPEHPSVMWELSSAIDGMSAACAALSIPVVGGNVSLYNESGGADIDPTPVVAVLGLLDELVQRPPSLAWHDGEVVVLVGPRSSELAGSAWAGSIHGSKNGRYVPMDLAGHARLCQVVASLVAREAGHEAPGLVGSIHDVSDGGLACVLAEQAITSGLGAEISSPFSVAEWFSESPSRVVVTTSRQDELLAHFRDAGIPAEIIGSVGGARLRSGTTLDVSVEDLARASCDRIPAALDDVTGTSA
jgi:phosphoribosylformylglycinamidine synthase subunit PurL